MTDQANINADNVSFGKPAVTGVFYTAPYGTALPTDATTALPAAWLSNGFVGKDGIKNAADTDTSSVEQMSGETVLTQITKFAETYQMTLIEVMRNTAASTAYGSGSASEDESGNLTITHAMPSGKFSAVIELALNGGKKDRIVIPNGSISKLGDRTFSGTEAMGYDITIAANAYGAYTTTDGRVGTSREFIAAVAA